MDRGKGSFRAYLSQMVRNELGMIYRREKARGGDRFVYIDNMDKAEGAEAAALNAAAAEMSTSGDDVWKRIDIEFVAAARDEALEHIYSNPAISKQKKDVYRAYVLEGRPIDQVAEQFGISRNLVSQIKVRMERSLLAVLAEMGVEP